MFVHRTDERGVWIETFEAPDNYVLPLLCYADAGPPELGEGQIAVRMGHAWRVRAVADAPSAPPLLIIGDTRQLLELSKSAFVDHLIAHTSMARSDITALKTDATMAPWWDSFTLATTITCPTVGTTSGRNTAAGLAALVGTTKITAPERQAVIDNWPRG